MKKCPYCDRKFKNKRGVAIHMGRCNHFDAVSSIIPLEIPISARLLEGVGQLIEGLIKEKVDAKRDEIKGVVCKRCKKKFSSYLEGN